MEPLRLTTGTLTGQRETFEGNRQDREWIIRNVKRVEANSRLLKINHGWIRRNAKKTAFSAPGPSMLMSPT